MDDAQLRQNAQEAFFQWLMDISKKRKINPEDVAPLKIAFLSGYVIAKKEF
jgi:hypothetical protein